MDSLDLSTSSTGGLVQAGATPKAAEEEHVHEHQATTPINGVVEPTETAQAATKKVVAKDKGGNKKTYKY